MLYLAMFYQADECIGGFGAYSRLYCILELSNWMIGCDVSGYGSSRVTDWRYREVSPQSLNARVLQPCCRWLSLGRNGMHGEVALCDGSTAMMLFLYLLDGD